MHTHTHTHTHTLFLHAQADGSSRVRMSYAGVGVDLNNDDIVLSDAQRKAAAATLSSDASASARGARQFVENVVDNLLCGGLFGKIEHYWFSTECQNRGSLHWHGLLWVASAPRSRAAFNAWLARNNKMTAETWLDSIVRESLPPMPAEYDVAEASASVIVLALVFAFFFVDATQLSNDRGCGRNKQSSNDVCSLSAKSQRPLMRSSSCRRFVTFFCFPRQLSISCVCTVCVRCVCVPDCCAG